MKVRRVGAGTSWRLVLHLLMFLAGLALAMFARAGEAVDLSSKKLLSQVHVLILSPGGLGELRSVDQYAQRLIESLREGGVGSGQIHFEFLDLSRNTDASYRQSLAGLLEGKYRQVHMDLVFCLGQPSMDFLFKEGRNIAPDAILMGWLAQIPAHAKTEGRKILLRTQKINVRGTLDLAFKLFPKTDHLLVVRGVGNIETSYEHQLREETQRWRGKVTIEDTSELSVDAMAERLRHLPERTVVLYFIVTRDALGHNLISTDVGKLMLENSNRPMFTLWDVRLSPGSIGGDVVLLDQEAAEFGKKALDVLIGATPLATGVGRQEGGTTPVFDWVQLQRWEADTHQLPPNALMLNQPPPLWSVYRTTVIWTAGVFAMVVLAALWLALLNRRLVRARSDVVALNATLDQKVTARTSELSLALEHLKHTQSELVQAEKLASLGAIVAGVSHELNTPIGNALTVSSTLEEETARLESHLAVGTLKKSELIDGLKNAHEMANLVERAMQRAVILIESFKRVAVDQTSEHRRVFDLRATVEDVLCTLRPSLRNYRIAIVNDIQSGIACDSFPGPLGQIVTNLIQNACIHGFDGLDAGNIRISASCGVGDQAVKLLVQDDGVGMDSVTLAHIFDPFFTTKLGKGGSGLGLSICHRIATTVLAGELTVVSEPQTGSCFTLHFPINAPGKF